MDCLSSDMSKMSLKKLNGDNYHNWKFNMELLLQGKDLWDYVDGTETLSAEANETDKKKWKKADNQARSLICLSVQENVQIYVRSSMGQLVHTFPREDIVKENLLPPTIVFC